MDLALDFTDLQFTSDGLVITLRRSKVDQEGESRKVGVPYGSNPDTCPVRSLKAWLEAAAIESGAVFRSVTRHGKVGARMSGYAAALVVKQYAGTLGLKPATIPDTHSGLGWQPRPPLPAPASGPS
jgi:hypothetical protein